MADYILHLATLACILTTAVVTLQLLVNGTGLLSVAQAVFLGIGAYAAALTATRLLLDGVAEVFIASSLALLVSLLISVPSLRLRDDYFAIATFGLQMISGGVLVNWVSVTNGPLGIGGIGPFTLGRLAIRPPYALLGAAVVLCAISLLLAASIQASRYGLILRAIRSDELFAQSLGKDTLRFKVKIIALSAVLTSISGVLYAHFLTYIDPSSFTLMDSIQLLSMVVIGGARPLGAAAGTMLLVLLPEGLRFLGLPAALAANLRQIVYGALLVVVIAFRPQGLFAWGQGDAQGGGR
jgi:branched-chain amino acid transport system permease protein